MLAFQTLGALIHRERAAVLTLNYDTLLESAIESASGYEETPPSYWESSETGRWVDGEWVTVWSEDREIYDELLPFTLSDCNWKRPLAYGFRFEEVQSNITNRSSTVPGERLYSHPAIELYDVPFLKLHGSLDWFRYTKYREDFSSGLVVDEEKAGQIRLVGHSDPMFMFRPFGLVAGTELPKHDHKILDPMIITPVLYKNLSEPPISQL